MSKYNIKEQLKETLAIIYPNGVSSKEQHRDVIRCYLMGWVDCAMALENPKAAKEWVEQLQGTQSEDWWPDASWCWWPIGSNFRWN